MLGEKMNIAMEAKGEERKGLMNIVKLYLPMYKKQVLAEKADNHSLVTVKDVYTWTRRRKTTINHYCIM